MPVPAAVASPFPPPTPPATASLAPAMPAAMIDELRFCIALID
jgi:hypothetical protein